MPSISKIFENFPDNEFRAVNNSRLIKDLNQGQLFAVIELASMKGNGYSIRWGFLIKSIPRLNKTKFNLENSHLDLSFDPIDYTEDSQNYIATDEKTLIYLALKFQTDIINYFKHIHDTTNLFPIYQEKIRRKAVRFNFGNYPQEEHAYDTLIKK